MLAVVGVLMVRPVLAAVVFALTAGHLLHPLYAWFTTVLPWRWPAGAAVLMLVAATLVGPFVLLAFFFIGDAQRLLSDLDEPGDLGRRLEELLTRLGVPSSSVEGLGDRVISGVGSWLQGEALSIAGFALEFLIGLVVFFIVLYYVLVDGPRLVQRLHFLPAPGQDIDRVLGQVSGRVKAIVYGTLVVALVQATIAATGWWLLGLPAPLFWGVVILILELIPVLGSFVVLLPAAVWAFLNGDVWTGVALLGLNFIMVGLVDDVLRPYLIGRKSGVHPVLVLIGIVGGLPLFGISGIILGPLLMGLLEPIYLAWAAPRTLADESAAKT